MARFSLLLHARVHPAARPSLLALRLIPSGSDQLANDIFFVVLPNKRQSPCIRSALPIDRILAVRLMPSTGLPSGSFFAVETDALIGLCPMCAQQKLRRYGFIQVVDRIIKA
jgi:hypothetical protein